MYPLGAKMGHNRITEGIIIHEELFLNTKVYENILEARLCDNVGVLFKIVLTC